MDKSIKVLLQKIKQSNRGSILLSVLVLITFLFFSFTLFLADFYRTKLFYIHSREHFEALAMRELAKQHFLHHYNEKTSSFGSYYFENGQIDYTIQEKNQKKIVTFKIKMNSQILIGEKEELELP